jgi:hypothetical protein
MHALDAANHFAHRESDGIVVDLFWDRGDADDRFRVEVEDRRMRVRFSLYAATGSEAIRAFHHPFATAASTHGKALAA